MLKANEELPQEGTVEEQENSGVGLDASKAELNEAAPVEGAAMLGTSDTPIKLGGG